MNFTFKQKIIGGLLAAVVAIPLIKLAGGPTLLPARLAYGPVKQTWASLAGDWCAIDPKGQPQRATIDTSNSQMAQMFVTDSDGERYECTVPHLGGGVVEHERVGAPAEYRFSCGLRAAKKNLSLRLRFSQDFDASSASAQLSIASAAGRTSTESAGFSLVGAQRCLD